MRLGATIGMAVCIALTSCAASLIAAVASLVFCPLLLLVFDIAFASTQDDRPFLWLETMFWLLPAFATVGACAGAFWAGVRLRNGRLPNKPMQPASAPSGARG